jgi:Lipase
MRNVTLTSTPTEDGCSQDGNFSVIVHGWMDGLRSDWVSYTVKNLLKHRGGCVYFFDYNHYAKTSNYFYLMPHFKGIADVIEKKMRAIGNYDRQYMFGFSFGSRLSIEVGKRIGAGVIDRMDICDPAGEQFSNDLWICFKDSLICRPWFRPECRS